MEASFEVTSGAIETSTPQAGAESEEAGCSFYGVQPPLRSNSSPCLMLTDQ